MFTSFSPYYDHNYFVTDLRSLQPPLPLLCLSPASCYPPLRISVPVLSSNFSSCYTVCPDLRSLVILDYASFPVSFLFSFLLNYSDVWFWPVPAFYTL